MAPPIASGERDPLRLARHHRDDEPGEEREGNRETRERHQGDRRHEGHPAGERATDVVPAHSGGAAPRAALRTVPATNEDSSTIMAAVPEREEARAGAVLAHVIPAPRVAHDPGAQRRECQARPEVAAAREWLQRACVSACSGRWARARRWSPRRAELHRDHARIAHDFGAVGLDLCGRLLDVGHLDREMVDAGPFARRLRFLGLGSRVVLHQGEVDLAVGHVPRSVVARLARLGVLETENLLVEVARLLQVVHLERQVHDAVDLVIHLHALVAADRHQLRDRPAGRPELDRDHARIAHHLASPFADRVGSLGDVGHFDREVVNAGTLAGRRRLLRPRARVVLHHREVDVAVGHVAREVVARLLRFRVEEAEDLLVEVPGPLHVVDLERDVDDPVRMLL